MKRNSTLVLLLGFIFQINGLAQILWTDPVFPTPSQPVTIYFDATQGTGGLANCNCDVYLHTGLITSASTSTSNWKYVVTSWGVANPAWQMSPVAGQPNVYSYVIGPSIKSYYGFTSTTEAIQKLAFVFRNANGSKEGKDVGNADIFYDVYPDNLGLSAALISPTSSPILTQINASIEVKGSSSQPATLKLLDNGNEIYSTVGTSLEHTIVVSAGGTHLVEFTADNGTQTASQSFTYLVPNPIVTEALPAGTDLGINLLNDSTALLALYAPNKQNVFLIGGFNDWALHTDFQLKRTPDGNTWWIQIGGLTPGEYTAFQYLVDGEIRIGDPYSPLVLDPGNDNFIPASTFPDKPPYPIGKTSGVVSAFKPGAPPFDWQMDNFQRPKQENLVIYEALLRDFLHEHNYQTLLERLDYLKDLGITALELMPVNEFSGNISWGYNPTFHSALDKYYGSPEAFKTLVDACHEKGIAVILDIVFNHSDFPNPLLLLYWDAANSRPAADNPWLNQTAPHDFSVFFDFNHESPATKVYFEKTLRYWLDEYRVDGFRFDLSKGLTQNVNGPFHAGNHDASRIAILKNYADVIWQTSPGAYIILEHFAANTEEKELSDYGMMLWAGGVHDQYKEAAMGYTSNLSTVSYKNRGWADAHLIGYMESHDEERMMYKNLQYGNSSGNYSVKNFPTALDRVELASTFFYTVPGPKMLWQFGELGYDFSINRCPNGTISNGCRVDPKPIRWDYLDNPDRVDVYNTVRALNHLRNNYEVFQTSDFTLNTGQGVKTIHLNHGSMNVAVLGNFNVTPGSVTPAFQHTGWWYEYFTGDSLNVTEVNAVLGFQPGEYRLYLDARVQAPVQYTASKEVTRGPLNWAVYPNPSAGPATVYFSLPQSATVAVEVFTLQGQKPGLAADGFYRPGDYSIELKGAQQPGMYLVRLSVDGVSETRKLVVKD